MPNNLTSRRAQLLAREPNFFARAQVSLATAARHTTMIVKCASTERSPGSRTDKPTRRTKELAFGKSVGSRTHGLSTAEANGPRHLQHRNGGIRSVAGRLNAYCGAYTNESRETTLIQFTEAAAPKRIHTAP
jgi:hypothetical protein